MILSRNLLVGCVFAAAGVSSVSIVRRDADAAPIVDLGYAQYQGFLDTALNITNFLGIRYAAPPTGKLRWRAPQAPASVKGVQAADTQPPECLQNAIGDSPTNPLKKRAVAQSEDCLFLRVFVPGTGLRAKDLPVVVYIHGGGYGQEFPVPLNAENLVTDAHHGVIAVQIRYRLGLFGFLAGGKVKQNGDLNAGLLDQDFALRWVNKHIQKFGGDPAKVTIWGESAGAGSVLQHVVAQNGETKPQLFRGAITSSTYCPPQYPFDDPISEALYREVLTQTHCTAAADSLACLRATDVNTLITANSNINLAGFFGTFSFVPVVDGSFIKQRPSEAMAQGKVNGQALLSVTNTHEGDLFVNQSTTLNAQQYATQLFPKFGEKESAAVAALYAGLGTSSAQANLIMGESIFICPTYNLLPAFPRRAFKGEFAIPPGHHGDDITYYFGDLGPVTFNNADFVKAFSQSFLAFVISLDPNTKFDPTNITPPWSKYSVNGRTEMLFNETANGLPLIEPVTTNSALLDRCKFWNSVSALTAQ